MAASNTLHRLSLTHACMPTLACARVRGAVCCGVSALYLDNNALTGPVPSALSSLLALQYLGLSFNRLTGPLPGFLARLQGLE